MAHFPNMDNLVHNSSRILVMFLQLLFRVLLCLSLIASTVKATIPSLVLMSGEEVLHAVRTSLLEWNVSFDRERQGDSLNVQIALQYVFSNGDGKRYLEERRTKINHVNALHQIISGVIAERQKMSASSAKRAMEAVNSLLDKPTSFLAQTPIEEKNNALYFGLLRPENKELGEKLRPEMAQMAYSIKWECLEWLDPAEKCPQESMEASALRKTLAKLNSAYHHYASEARANANSSWHKDPHPISELHANDVEREMALLESVIRFGRRIGITLLYALLYQRLGKLLPEQDPKGAPADAAVLARQWFNELLKALKELYAGQRKEFVAAAQKSRYYSAEQIVAHWDKLIGQQ